MNNTKLSENLGGGVFPDEETFNKFMTNALRMHHRLQKLYEIHTRNLEVGLRNILVPFKKIHSGTPMNAVMLPDRKAV